MSALQQLLGVTLTAQAQAPPRQVRRLEHHPDQDELDADEGDECGGDRGTEGEEGEPR